MFKLKLLNSLVLIFFISILKCMHDIEKKKGAGEGILFNRGRSSSLSIA